MARSAPSSSFRTRGITSRSHQTILWSSCRSRHHFGFWILDWNRASFIRLAPNEIKKLTADRFNDYNETVCLEVSMLNRTLTSILIVASSFVLVRSQTPTTKVDVAEKDTKIADGTR